ncbi:hypothetical protein SAMN05444166_1191 [Singulisphaera sp. GP187]|uniref:hypothetical protein n=1 Tax=Singulisphaera sp. GP187 TaxID=1882752 RepID=UPI00092B876C|nr:hypothetical protein [Singulisphaera sp. GP187]SIN83650.1 hypothetical protein SAMN05444166_1191 [Singulisphaera sp. GP187]
MTKRRCLSQLIWPSNPADAQLPVDWASSVAIHLMDCLWRSYDQLRQKHLARIDLTQDPIQLERGLTEIHFLEIQLIWRKDTGGFASVIPSHEADEFETVQGPSAKPIAYDLCFVHFMNARWKLPIEAKVLQTDGAIAEYLIDVRNKFVAGRGAPLVGVAGMIGYLLHGTPATVFANLEAELKQSLQEVAEFPTRPHRISQHARATTPELKLHHMIMQLESA